MPVSPNHANRRKSSDAAGSLQQQQQQAFVLDSKTPQEFKRQLHDHMAEKEKEQALEARRHAQAVAQTADAQRNLEEFGANVMDDAALLMHRAARTGEALRDAGASELGAIPPPEHLAHHKVIDLDEVTTATKRKAPAAAAPGVAAPDDDDVTLHRHHRHQHHRGETSARRKAALRAAIFRAPGFASALDWPRMLLAPLGHEARQALGFFLVLVLPISVAYLLLFSSYRPSLNKLEHFVEKLPRVGGMRRGGQMPNGAWDDGVGTCWVSPAAATAAWTQPTTFDLGSGSGFVHCDPLSAPNGKCYLHASTAGPI